MQLVLGAAGAGIGSLFGAASIGWSIGSFLGGQLFNKGQDVKGPRLTDKSVSGSAYGNLRPLIYGTYRVGGEVIWTTDLVEHSHKEEQGKGAGGSYTTYSYTVSFAVALCAGEIAGVRKIWLDGKLVYTRAADATSAELIKSDKMAKRIRFYNGTSDQMPDSVMESALGSGNVPGYRGTAYLVFEDLDVGDYGQRRPIVTVEVVSSGSLSLSENFPDVVDDAGTWQALWLDNGVANAYWWGYTSPDSNTFERRVMKLDGTVRSKRRTTVQASNFTFPQTLSPNGTFVLYQTSPDGGFSEYISWSRFSNGFASSLLPGFPDIYNYSNGTDASTSIRWIDDKNFFYYKANSGDLYRYKFKLSPLTGQYYCVLDWQSIVDSSRHGTDPTMGALKPKIAVDKSTGECYVETISTGGTGYTIKRISADGDIIESKTLGSIISTAISYDNGLLWKVDGYVLSVYDWETEESIFSQGIASSITSGHFHMEVAGNLAAFLVAGNLYTASITLSRNDIALSSVVSDLCTRQGIGSIDSDYLSSDMVHGFMVGSQMSSRDAIQHLASPYFFDGVESDGVLKFVKRGASVSTTFANDDIGCYDGEMTELWEATRVQEEELPQEMTLTYAQFDADYQQGAQFSRREISLSGTKVGIQLSLALTDDEAKEIVDTMMFTAWQNRHGIKFSTWQKYQKIEPTDVVSVRGETVRIINRNEGVNGLIELEGVRELPAIYTGQVGAGASGSQGGQSVRVGGPTQFKLLDIPPLRDADYANYGMYWAGAGMLDDWPGGALLKSSDNGDAWTLESNSMNAATLGYASTELGDFAGGNIFDELNTVRVAVNGTLSSATRAQVLNGANIMLIGDEIIQFRTATLITTGVYDLTGLLRGRLGTEWSMGAHAEDEDVALLDSSTVRYFGMDTGDYNTLRLYGAVTQGDTIEDVSSEYFTYAGHNVKPLSPIHLGGGKTTHDGSWTLTWVRRTRYGWAWVDGRDALMDETTEGYEVAILDVSGDTLRTISTSTDSCTYTLDQQAEDFGGAKGSIDFKVRQTGALRDGEWSDAATVSSGFSTTTKLLLTTDGVDGSTDITDVYGNTVSVVGSAQISTAWSAFIDSTSIALDGAGSYLWLPNNNINISGDVTIEGFIYTTSVAAGYFGIFHMDGQLLLARKGSTIVLWYSSDQITSATISVGVKYHVAVTRASGTWRLFVNGTKAATDWVNSSTFGPVDIYIGRYLTSYFTGYIDDNFRVKVGEALYTADFIPPIESFTG
jgi:hypothetical protein